VSDGISNNPNPFDVQTIKQLVALMSRHDLSEIDLRIADQRIRLRRGKLPSVVSMGPASAMSAAAPTAAVSAPPPADGAPKPAARNLKEIKSPLVGTFYSSAKPGAEPFVKAGSRVTPTTVVGLIEAMKLFNDIPAECSGTIAEVLVENQQAVEYGQVLFLVDPT
jgi:acetyl-CoA carboxylase biotin carboxyl carrier protein